MHIIFMLYVPAAFCDCGLRLRLFRFRCSCRCLRLHCSTAVLHFDWIRKASGCGFLPSSFCDCADAAGLQITHWKPPAVPPQPVVCVCAYESADIPLHYRFIVVRRECNGTVLSAGFMAYVQCDTYTSALIGDIS